MTRKDYEKAAEIVRRLPASEQPTVARAFVELFLGDNPRFDSARFYERVGGTGVKRATDWERL